MSRTYRIIYVEDEETWANLLRDQIDNINKLKLNKDFEARCELIHVKTGESLLSLLATDGPFHLALIDLQLQGVPGQMQGEDLLYRLQRMKEAPPRVVLTAREWILPVQKALGFDISEYYIKDKLTAGGVQHVGESHLEDFRSFFETFFDLPSRYDFASEEGRERFGLRRSEAKLLQETLIGNELRMWQLKARIAAAARSDLPVLITGESGTGKELTAQMIHRLSDRGRKNHDWVALNCAALAPELLMSELFGHVKGAFTDARVDKRGLLEEADKSTLFLDEVGHADRQFQASLLRALSSARARRIGSTEEYTFDVRLIAATDQPIFESNRLERSFINRLAGIHIEVPPLRDRKCDIDIDKETPSNKLVSFLVDNIAGAKSKNVEFTPAAIMALQRYDWPGNVRELSHVIRASTLEAIRQGGTAPEVTVDAPQVNWFLQSMAHFESQGHKDIDIFELYMEQGYTYKNVERALLARYVYHVHQEISDGERTNAAYEKTAKFLDCSVSTVKTKLADYSRFVQE